MHEGKHYSMQRSNLGNSFHEDMEIKVENWPNVDFEGNTVAKQNNENL